MAESHPAEVFDAVWGGLVDLLGTAATAALVRRSVKRASRRFPAVGGVAVTRERYEYRYTLPASWTDGAVANEAGNELRALARELRLVLLELTGPVVVQRISVIPEIERSRIFSSPSETSDR